MPKTGNNRKGYALTARQAECLAVIDAHRYRTGHFPSCQEIASALSIKETCGKSAVSQTLSRLEAKGFLRRCYNARRNRTYRTIRIIRRVDGDRLLHRGRWVKPGQRIEYRGCAVTWQPVRTPTETANA